LVNGLAEIVQGMGVGLGELAGSIETMVHGTTVTTNAVLTLGGARTGLLTTEGVRDALEMRGGIREEQYNNRYTNVTPLVPRFLRRPVRGRLNYRGDELAPLQLEDVEAAIELFVAQQVEAVAICFMNSFADAGHEEQVARLVREKLPGAYLTVSSDFLPSIRFYDRVSSTVLNSYVGPKLSSYLDHLGARLREIGFGGVLLIMQSELRARTRPRRLHHRRHGRDQLRRGPGPGRHADRGHGGRDQPVSHRAAHARHRHHRRGRREHRLDR
jgi:N-methylhydantoinase A